MRLPWRPRCSPFSPPSRSPSGVTDRRPAFVYLARYDALTALANRRQLGEHLDALFAFDDREHGHALHIIDLNRFKFINDTYGHPFGDMLLKRVADRLLALVRPSDLVARLGGDEFAIVQSLRFAQVEARALAERICRELAEPFEIGHVRVVIGATVGIGSATDDADSAGRASEGGGSGALRRESRRQRRLPLLRRQHDARRPRPHRHREWTEDRDRQRRAAPLLSADRFSGRTEDRRLRSADPLDPAGTRHGFAVGFHTGGRGDRSHRQDRRVGVGTRLQRHCGLARADPGRGQLLAAPVRARGRRRQRADGALPLRSRAEPARDRDHGIGLDEEQPAGPRPTAAIAGDRRPRVDGRFRHWLLEFSATSNAFPSPRSRSTARSSRNSDSARAPGRPSARSSSLPRATRCRLSPKGSRRRRS